MILLNLTVAVGFPWGDHESCANRQGNRYLSGAIAVQIGDLVGFICDSSLQAVAFVLLVGARVLWKWM